MFPLRRLFPLSRSSRERNASLPLPRTQALPELASRPSTGVAFSGGGSRGYVAALAQLCALRSLGLLDSVRYATAISGGGWAASVFTYYQPGAPGAPADDDELLGAPACAPEDVDESALGELPPRAARGSVCRASLFDEAIRELQAGASADAAWRAALHRVIFAPMGIPADAPFTWSAATAADIARRNPATLNASDFLIPRAVGARPYLILGITALGPLAMVPHRPLRLRSYTLLEATPLYVGHARTLHARFASSIPGMRAARSATVLGGYVEPFAFGGGEAPARGLAGAHAGTLDVPIAGQRFSLAAAAAASSYAPGALLATQLPGRRLGRRLGVALPYWSPALAAPRATEFLYADGGCVANPALISLLQRRVARVVLFCNFQTPLKPRGEWDPFVRPPTPSDISEEIPSFFGMVLDSAAWSFARNAVFARTDFPRVVAALQDAAAAGAGAVATLELVTVANSWWGIPAGQRVTVTWCYLAAAPAWAERLPPALGARLRDPKDALFGTTFPHFGTMDLALAPPQVNLLHQLSAWVVVANADAFRAALAPQVAPAADARREGLAAQGAGLQAAPPLRGGGARAGGRAGGGRGVAVAAAAAAAALAAAAGSADAAATAASTGDAAAAAAGDAPEPPVARSRLSNAISALLGTLPSG
jgi:hypothetical protein